MFPPTSVRADSIVPTTSETYLAASGLGAEARRSRLFATIEEMRGVAVAHLTGRALTLRHALAG